jgi:hypothetical protein
VQVKYIGTYVGENKNDKAVMFPAQNKTEYSMEINVKPFKRTYYPSTDVIHNQVSIKIESHYITLVSMWGTLGSYKLIRFHRWGVSEDAFQDYKNPPKLIDIKQILGSSWRARNPAVCNQFGKTLIDKQAVCKKSAQRCPKQLPTPTPKIKIKMWVCQIMLTQNAKHQLVSWSHLDGAA